MDGGGNARDRRRGTACPADVGVRSQALRSGVETGRPTCSGGIADRLVAVPEPVAAVVAARHTQSGVSLFCNTEVAEICQVDSGFTVTATDGLSWRADVMIAGIGEVPETQLAEGCGLEVENGIRVNEQLRTSKPDI